MSHYPQYQNFYGIGLFDDIHNYFPDMIYNPGRFSTVQDLLLYMREQIRYRTDRYSYAVNHFGPQTPLPRPRHFTTVRPQVAPINETGGNENLQFLDSLLNIFGQPTGTISFFNTTLGGRPINLNNLTPVTVAPTAEQLARGTEVYNAGPADRTSQCMICLETFIEGTQIRRITHCQHKFHKNCIDVWFTRNVHCPNCRHDVREIDDEYEDEDDDDLH